MQHAESAATVAPNQDHCILALRDARQRLLYVSCIRGFLSVDTDYHGKRPDQAAVTDRQECGQQVST